MLFASLRARRFSRVSCPPTDIHSHISLCSLAACPKPYTAQQTLNSSAPSFPLESDEYQTRLKTISSTRLKGKCYLPEFLPALLELICSTLKRRSPLRFVSRAFSSSNMVLFAFGDFDWVRTLLFHPQDRWQGATAAGEQRTSSLRSIVPVTDVLRTALCCLRRRFTGLQGCPVIAHLQPLLPTIARPCVAFAALTPSELKVTRFPAHSDAFLLTLPRSLLLYRPQGHRRSRD